MSRNKFYLDMSQVMMRMGLLNDVIIPAKIRRGLKKAGTQLMVDVVATAPTAPIRRPGYPQEEDRVPGELRASGAVYVDTIKKANSKLMGETATGKYQPTTYGGTPIPKGTHEACVVFNAPYAAEQHMGWPDKTEPGAGMYYLSGKLVGQAPMYAGIIARALRL